MSSTCRATPSSISSRISPPATGRSSCTTTAIACGRSAIANWPTPRARFAARLTAAGIRADDKVVIWSENRARVAGRALGLPAGRASCSCRWITARRPISSCASPQIVQAKAVLVGTEVQAPAGGDRGRVAAQGPGHWALGLEALRSREPRHPGATRNPGTLRRRRPSPKSSSPPARRPNRKA